MPELPEVETVARGVDERVRGRNIVSVRLGRKPEPFKTSRAAMQSALLGRSIARVHRVGKHIVVDLAEGQDGPVRMQWLVHLGMTGRLLVSRADVPTPAHTHAVLSLDDGREVRFVDARRFGRLALHSINDGCGFAGTGREPLTITALDFAALFAGRSAPVKALLLNQKLLHGVGNIYADESLFRAGILPTRAASSLSHAELLRLRRALQTVLRRAIAKGGSSVSDYVDADGVRGFFQLEHCVYLRTGQPCRVCGAPIQRSLVAGRGTHVCLRCQK
jgi:formamidopyrimidine-DNA glycosylase